jgi:sorbitol-specific phosphotransferase system component IIA
VGGVHELHANGIAQYRWGSQMVSMLGSATANGQMVAEILTQVMVGTFRWTKPRDVGAAIAILHELIHLQQDVATGVGAWDHLQTRESIRQLVGQSRWFVNKLSHRLIARRPKTA